MLSAHDADAEYYLCPGAYPFLVPQPVPGCAPYDPSGDPSLQTPSDTGQTATPDVPGEEGGQAMSQKNDRLTPKESALIQTMCNDYFEWMELYQRTHGGVVNQSTDDRRRFTELQRQFGLITQTPDACL